MSGSFVLRSGSLDRQITIEQVTLAANSHGERIETWASYATVWANVRENGGDESLLRSSVEIAQRRALFTIRYRTDIVEAMRISWDDHIWDIEVSRQLGRRQGLELSAVARVDV